MSTLSRRQVAAGLAWSAPAVAAAAAAPAFAASGPPCGAHLPVALVAGRFHWGTYDGTPGVTDQQLQLFTRMQVMNVAPGSVESFTATYTISRRADGTPGPGLPWIGETASDYSPERAVCTTTECAEYEWTGHNYPSDSSVLVKTGDGASPEYTVSFTVRDFTDAAYYDVDLHSAYEPNEAVCGYTFDTGTFGGGTPTPINLQNTQDNDYRTVGTPFEVWFSDMMRVTNTNQRQATMRASFVVRIRVGSEIQTKEFSFPAPLHALVNQAYYPGGRW
ncbi:hypothetical protein [Micrococcus sp.]|uniref:hypothetical protein n=1 Tax=Micrococcus sp. TaxID=1271 RepID=UPI002A90CA76|nr:hypothetical protein [Micrococcus sp.]MDY6054539.1 hypothetical protein [Micrococcus sp.]